MAHGLSSTSSVRQEVRNAAIILLSLPDAEAASLLRCLDVAQIETVSRAIADLDSIHSDEQQSALRLFAGDPTLPCSAAHGGVARSEQLIRLALGESADELIGRLREQSIADPLSSLDTIDNRTLAELLIHEHPQTSAAILSHLPTRRVAEILDGLHPEQRLGIVHRIAKSGTAHPAAIRDVALCLVQRAGRAHHKDASAWPLPLAS